MKVLDGFLVQQASSSPHQQFVLAFPAVWTRVGAFETVDLELSQKGFEFLEVEDYFKYLDNCCFVVFVVDFEGLSIGHPGYHVIVAASFGVFEHVVETFREYRGSCPHNSSASASTSTSASASTHFIARTRRNGSGADNSLIAHCCCSIFDFVR